MKKKYTLSYDDFIKSEYYIDFEKGKKNIMSFDEFIKAQQSGVSVELIVMTYDISGAKSYDYRQLWSFLSRLGFQKSINGRPMPKNTFILPVNNHNFIGIMNSIVAYIISTKRHFKVFGCLTNTYQLTP